MKLAVTACTFLLCLGAAGAVTGAPRATANKQIVVTFADRSLTRVEFGRPGTDYVQPAPYAASSWSKRIAHALARDYDLSATTEWPLMTLGVYCVVYEIHGERAVDEVIDVLTKDQRVGTVQAMHQFQALSGDPYYPLQSNLSATSVEEAHRWATGRNVTIAIIDTGIDEQHPDLRGQVIAAQNLVDPDAALTQDDIHGTAVAGVIAAIADNGQGIVGVAPAAKLLAFQACWPRASGATTAICNSLTLARALDAVLRTHPQILNLSLAGPHDPLLSSLVALAIAQGTIVVAAEPEGAIVRGFPADVEQVLRVRASGADNTSGGILSAPGNEILTTFPHATYHFVSGSSFAAAHVSGVVALLKELRPELTSAEVEQVLKVSSQSTLPSGRAGFAAASVSACAAVATIKVAADCVHHEAARPLSPPGSGLKIASLRSP